MRAYKFHDFELHPAERELRRNGDRIQVSARTFDCLLWLIEHRDRAVGRDELIAAVWGKTDLGDNLLAQLVSRARGLIGDTGEQQLMIRTVAGFGYRWVGTVQWVDGDGAVHPSSDAVPVEFTQPSAKETPASPTSPGASVTFVTATTNGEDNPQATSDPATTSTGAVRFLKSIAIPVAFGLLLLLAAGALYRFAIPQLWPSADFSGNSAVVLPIELEQTEGNRWMRLGLMSLAAERLQEAGQPVVPSDNVIALMRGIAATPTPAELVELGKATGASLIIGGTARQSGVTWRISLRTIQGREPPLVAEGTSDDALVATSLAINKMATLLGYSADPANNVGTKDQALENLVRKAEALMLSGQSRVAMEVLDGATAEQRKTAEVRYQQARIEAGIGHYEQARTAFEALLRDLPAERNPIMRARSLTALGSVLYFQFHNRKPPGVEAKRVFDTNTRKLFDEAIGLLEDRNEPRELGRALVGRARLGSPEEELADYSRARIALEVAGDRLGVSVAIGRLGIVNAAHDHFSEALPDLQNAIVRLADFHVVDLKIELWANIALIHLASLDFDAATHAQAQIAELNSQTDFPGLHDATDLLRARILMKTGRLREAQTLWQSAYAAVLDRNDLLNLFQAHATVAAWDLLSTSYPAAEEEARAAVSAGLPDEESARDQAGNWLVLLRALVAQGQSDKLEVALKDMEAWADRDGSPVARGYLALAQAESLAIDGPTPAIESAYTRAMTILDAGRISVDLAAATASYAGWLIRDGRLERASDIAGRVANWADRDFELALIQVRLYGALGRVSAWRTALERARVLAGERSIPAELLVVPTAR